MYNREIHVIQRKLRLMFEKYSSEPNYLRIVAETADKIAEAMKELNPKFNKEEFIHRVTKNHANKKNGATTRWNY